MLGIYYILYYFQGIYPKLELWGKDSQNYFSLQSEATSPTF